MGAGFRSVKPGCEAEEFPAYGVCPANAYWSIQAVSNANMVPAGDEPPRLDTNDLFGAACIKQVKSALPSVVLKRLEKRDQGFAVGVR